MPDIPEKAIDAAAEAIMVAQNANDVEAERWEANHLAAVALEAAAPHVRTAERNRIAREIPPDRLDELAGWFDDDDEMKMSLYTERPDLWPATWGERSHELQDDLRRWAALLREGR